MEIQLSDHFTYKKLFRYVLPSILMMLFTSTYSIVDGLFVSNFVGKTAFAAVNLIMPLLLGVSSVGFMLGTGGSAIVSMTLGQGKPLQANRYFSMIVYATFVLGCGFAVLGFFLSPIIAQRLGATDDLLSFCITYGRILFAAIPLYMLQTMFQSFFVVAEKPSYNLKVTMAAGLTNIVLDFVFIKVFSWGVAGAAFATVIGYGVGSIIPLVYFFRPHNSSLLHLGKTEFYGRIFVKTCTNGSSEMVSNLSASVVGFLYNLQLMKYAGEDGVAAYGVLMYAGFIFVSLFIGYAIGSSPIVSYHYGAKNRDELHNMFRKGLLLMLIGGVVLVSIGQLFARPLVALFTGYDKDLMLMTLRGGRISLFCFLFTGINIWGSSFFTALNNGLVSALISFLRTLVFQVATILILPLFFGLTGIWCAMVAADVLAALVTMVFLIKLRGKYGY